jgi:hypothetical protein
LQINTFVNLSYLLAIIFKLFFEFYYSALSVLHSFLLNKL